ncbi:MAG: Ig-like domain-containing protein [Deltaproteobacteria bacterium]|nr:Ig-like domain-containing protein [Deltaproteobacteria bacterium]
MPVKKSSLISYVLGLVAALLLSSGCGDNWIPEGQLPDPGTSSKEITKFTINGVDGTIAGTNIALTVPFGTNVASLSPQIVHTGASINPASDVTQNFTSPVSYTVTAIDGTTQAYQATVSVAASDAKDITRFTILGVDGVINGTSITLTLPFATAVQNLTPTIVHTGVSINPPSGIAANFTSPVDYTVRAADGSTKKYTVTVMAATSNSKDITKFTILGVDGVINGTNISLTLPFGTSLLSLTPTIMHTGISVTPTSGAAQSFLAPVLYTVSAVDFSTKVYTVTVNVAPSSSKDITQFQILGIDGTISGTNISLQVPFGTNRASLTPTITHTGASVSPASGVPNNFTGPATYVVTAADGSTKSYTVNVTAAPSTAKDITQFSILGVDGAIAGTSISLTLPFGTSLASLTPTIAHTGASISPLSGVAQSFAAPVMYTVTAADGSMKTYTVVVSVAPSNAKDITQFTINGVAGAITGTSITLTLPFGTNLATLTPTIMHTGQSVSPASGVTQSFTSPRQYTVTAMDGSTKTYTVTVSLGLNTSKDITRFTILGLDGTINGTNITLQLPFGTSLTSLTPTITITGVSVSPASGIAQDFTAARQYVVTAADGSTKTYTVTVTAALNNSKDIIAFAIFGVDGNIIGTNINVTLPQGTVVNSLTPTIVHTGASINPPSGVSQNFTNPVQYTVTAADGSTKTYTVTVFIAASSSKNITQFSILGINGTIGINTITLVVPFGTPLNNLTPTITHTGVSISPASGVAQNFSAGSVIYTVTAADGTMKPYTVTVTAAASAAKFITKFTINTVNGTIVEGPPNTITLTLPPGTSLTGLMPVIEFTGTSVTPASMATQNFTSPVTYTVRAADNSTKDYLVTVISPQLVSIAVTPPDRRIAQGTNLGYTATGRYSDNSTLDITSQVVWSTGDMNVASISTAGLARGVNPGTTKVIATLGLISGSTDLEVTAAALVSIAVEPPTPSIAKGTDQLFVAIGTYTDGSTQPVVGVSWSTDDISVATISAAGLAHGEDQGTTVVTATDLATGIFGTTTLAVTMATLVSLQVTPIDPSTPLGTDKKFTATGRYSDNTLQDLSSTVTWTSSLVGVATVSATGLAHSVSPGTTEITADAGGGISDTTTLEVTPAVLLSIEVSPSSASIAEGRDQQFDAIGTYTDGNVQTITDEVTWSSSDNGIATISNAQNSEGLAHGEDVGTVTITAELDGVTGTATLEVTTATLLSIEVFPFDPNMPRGTARNFTAEGTYTNGNVVDLTTAVTWTSTDSNIAFVSNSGLTKGRVTAANVGVATITATLDGVSGDTVVNVVVATLASISVEPATPSIALGTKQQFKAVGVYTDASTDDLTASVTWDTSNPLVALISNGVSDKGLATSKQVGSTTITATLGLISGTAVLTVSAATLIRIEVTPSNQSLPRATTDDYTATGVYSDATTVDLTDLVTWSSSSPTVASISNANNLKGTVSTLVAGTTTITAFDPVSMMSGSTSLTVTNGVLESITVTPNPATIAIGARVQFTATGNYSDGTSRVITNAVSWSSSSPAIAGASNGRKKRGIANGKKAGMVTITATDGATGIFGTASLTVTNATLQTITILPANTTIPNTTNQFYQAIGNFSDGSTSDITGAVSWTSTNTAVATISNQPFQEGIATAASVGTTTIQALDTSTNILGSTPLTVSSATLVSIAVTPGSPTIIAGATISMIATATYSDNSTKIVTREVTWTSMNPAAATISNAFPTQGLLQGIAMGSTEIRAQYPLTNVIGSTTATILP